MKTIKNKLFLATAILALASCADNTYLGDQEINTQEKGRVISFGSNTPSLTRAEGADAATVLGNSFNVYAVKYDGANYTNVFAKNTYAEATTGDASATPYVVTWTDNSAGSTASNTKNWEYVTSDQTIKYWDYSADHYEFVAYKATAGTPTITKYRKDGFTVAATAAELAGLYVADKLTISAKNNTPTQPSSGYNQIGDIVKFTFRAAGAKVRLGIYETIPGYAVKNVSFRANGSEFTSTTDNAILTGSFNGSSSSSSATYNVIYGPQAIFTQEGTTAQSTFFDFGTFASASTTLGTSSTTPMWASGNANYQSVLPNTDHVGDMILYVNYDLYNSTSGETIHVYGAKAVVPQMYMTWRPNYAYTYLFKISDNTNGKTSETGGTPEGLFPITFDAVTIATTDGQNVGTITTVSTPAITTYQNGSVSDAGITYATAATTQPIYITVNRNGTLADLTASNIKLYTVADGTTEADLILTTKTKTLVEGSAADALSILTAAETSQGISFSAGTTAKFTPAAPVSPATTTTYALEYQVSAAVAAAYTEVSSPVVADISTYYERSGSDPNYTYAKTTDTAIETSKTYYTLTTPASPAVYQYKIIVVQ